MDEYTEYRAVEASHDKAAMELCVEEANCEW
jgi:hypothetical protein